MNYLGQIALRWNVLKMKAAHQLPQLDWADVYHDMFWSSSKWHTEKLVHPLDSPSGGLVPFDSPIGICAFPEAQSRALGEFVLVQMMHTYEHGPVVLKQGDIVVDWGAHAGTFSRYALSHGAKIVVAFEPEPEHIRCLQTGFREEIAQGRMFIVPAAAWNQDTALHFHSEWCMSRVTADGELEVPARSLDSVVRELNLPRIDFIKADIEGAERFALQGAHDAIARFHPRMAICTYHLPDDPDVIPRIVNETYPYHVAFNLGHDQAFFSPAKEH